MGLRVLAVLQSAELGGAELALLRTAPRLVDEHEVKLELALPGDGPAGDRARALGLAVHRLELGSLRTGGWPRAALAWPRTRQLVRRVAPNVVWLNGVVPQRVVPALGRVPALLHLHDLVENRPRPWGSPSFWSRVPVVACPSEAVARAAAAAGAPEARLKIVPEPIEPAAPAPRPQWADGQPVIGFVGRFEPRKGVLDLLEAARLLDGVRLVLVRGPDIEPDREYQRAVDDAVAALGDSVLVTGPVDDATSLMPWFDVLCVPSHAEPFGTVAAEALAAGTPAVVTDSGGMSEYVVDGQSGAVVPPRDPRALAAALERTLAHAGAMAETAREAAAPFAAPRIADQIASLLREAVQE